MKEAVRSKLGDPHIIVNNAVTQYPWTSVLEQSLEDYESQFRTCVLHNVLMAKAFVPEMIARKFGRVIAISTECAMQNTPSQSAYVSGKRGMDGVLRVLAREIGKHQITVNQVAPGWMISDRDPISVIDTEGHKEIQPAPANRSTSRRAARTRRSPTSLRFWRPIWRRSSPGPYDPAVCGGNGSSCQRF